MRCLFVRENRCAERLLTAENDAFYTTFTEMLAQRTEAGDSNRLITRLGAPLLELLYDLLVLPEGPRVRDKMGHGELEIWLNNDGYQERALANILMAVSLILMQNSKYYSDSKLFNLFFKDYTPIFHPSSKLKRNLVKIIRVLYVLDYEKVKKLLVDSVENESNERSIHSESFGKVVDQEEFIHLILCHRPKTLFRPKEEYELLQILTKLAENVILAVDRSVQNFEEKYFLLIKKELRSRQRKTLQKALKVLPEMKSVFYQLCCSIFLLLEKVTSLSCSNDFKTLIGQLKNVLKCCENIASNVSLQKNRWDEVSKIVVSLNESLPSLENMVLYSNS